MADAAELFGNTHATPFLSEILKQKVALGEEDPHVLLHKEVDVYDESGKFLLGIREEFLNPYSEQFVKREGPRNTWKVSLATIPKRLSESNIEPQPLEELDNLEVMKKFTRRHANMPYPIHKWPLVETKKLNKVNTYFVI